MAINQNTLNSLMTTFTFNSNMMALRDQRANFLHKLQQRTDNGKMDGIQQQAGDIKHQIRNLAIVDKQSAQETYDEIYKKLEGERLEREAMFASKERDRERMLAKHERHLENRSMSKILSGSSKINHPAGAYSGTFSGDSQGDKKYVSDVDYELQESVQYGIAAAEVATRRKKAETRQPSSSSYKQA